MAASGLSIVSFFVFNPTLGQKEGREGEKIMFYYPQHVDVDEKNRRVGLAETFMRFSGTFGGVCEAVLTSSSPFLLFLSFLMPPFSFRH